MAQNSVTVDLPHLAFEQLQQAAHQQNRSISEIARDLILQELPGLPFLPKDLQEELAAFAGLSNDVLWLLARSTLPETQQKELALLNDEAQKRPLTAEEKTRQQTLLDAYDHLLVRRSHAAALLRQRGFDLSDPAVLEAP